MADTGGNNVIRYNHLYTTDGNVAKLVQDGISGSTNGTQQGAPGQDSDIYMNRVENASDTASKPKAAGKRAHLEELHRHVRDRHRHHRGHDRPDLPLAKRHQPRQDELYGPKVGDEDDRVQAFKSGTFSGTGGRRYVFHNSVMQLTQSGFDRGLGHGNGIAGNTDEPNTNTVSRNNVFHDWAGGSPYEQISSSVNFDYDMAHSYAGTPAGSYAHPFIGAPPTRSDTAPARSPTACTSCAGVPRPRRRPAAVQLQRPARRAASVQRQRARPRRARREPRPERLMKFGPSASGS